MYALCRHIKPNGLRCESPALKGQNFCYYHSKVHTVGAELSSKYGPLQLPAPEDPAAVQLAVARISDAILNGRIDLKKAASLLYALQIAAQFIDRKKYFNERRTVQDAELTPQGEDLAPHEFICKENDDCNKCPYTEICTAWVYIKDEKEEAEETEEETDDTNDSDEDDKNEKEPE
jgi:hypothetical protein